MPGHRSVEVAVLDLVLAEAAEGQHAALAEAAERRHWIPVEAEVPRMGEGQRSGAPPSGAASDR